VDVTVTSTSVHGHFGPWSLKPRPHQQQCRSNVRLWWSGIQLLDVCFAKKIDWNLSTVLCQAYQRNADVAKSLLQLIILPQHDAPRNMRVKRDFLTSCGQQQAAANDISRLHSNCLMSGFWRGFWRLIDPSGKKIGLWLLFAPRSTMWISVT